MVQEALTVLASMGSNISALPSDRTSVIASATSSNVRERALKALGQLPPFSPILNRLIASLAHEDVSFAKLADLIEKDTVLAGNVLRLVNSALYGLCGTVSSIRHAIALLGIGKLRNAMLTMSVSRMWSQLKTPPGWSTAHFNLHSVATAILSDLLAQRIAVNYAEGAFAAGLFHDLGLLLIALGSPEEYQALARLHTESGKSLLDCERDVLGLTHSELSAEALAAWNLPEPIQMAVRYQNTPVFDPSPLEPDQISLSRVLCSADQYVRSIGIAHSFLENPPEDGLAVLESLGVGSRLTTVIGEFENEFSAIKPYF
ncbi:MAG TPA: HDOD domain-containing protein [Bryobacteraceae bacterium]|nr:HDOD domain-containing protein [Bryobacteraceae bacterium]